MTSSRAPRKAIALLFFFFHATVCYLSFISPSFFYPFATNTSRTCYPVQFASSGAVSIFVFASNLRGPVHDVSSPKTERRLLSPDRSLSILDVTRISRILSEQWKFGFPRRGKRYRFVPVNEKNDERFLIPRVVSAGSAERSGSSEVAIAARRRKKKEERPLSEQLS